MCRPRGRRLLGEERGSSLADSYACDHDRGSDIASIGGRRDWKNTFTVN